MKQLPITNLKGSSYVGASLYRLCVPCAFGERAEFDMNASHIFPQGVLPFITLVVGGAGDRQTRAGTLCVVGLPLFSVALTTLFGAGSGPKLLEQKP